MALSKEILDNINQEELSKAFSKSSEKDRVGDYAYVFSDAVSKINLIRNENYNQLYVFDGTRYVPIKDKDVESEVDEAMILSGIPRSTITEKFTKMMSSIWRNSKIRPFNPTRSLICFDNCVFDIKTGNRLEFSPSAHVVHKLPFSYDPDAKHPKWSKFLLEVLPERDCREALQMFLGMVFLDRSESKMEKMMVLIGTGSNGKSVIFDTVKYVLGGNDNVSAYEIKSLIGDSSTSQYNIAAIDGKMINYCTEMDKKVLDTTKVKALISGEPLPARVVYKEPFMAERLPIMMANANEYPKTNDHSDGFFRRFIFIPFDVKITADKANQSLPFELQKEASGIFNWMWEGYNMAKANKFKINTPEKSLLAMDSYKAESNSVYIFLRNNSYSSSEIYTSQEPISIKSSDIYKDYVLFCAQNGFKEYSITEFSKMLSIRGINRIRKASGNHYMLYRIPEPSEYDRLKKDCLISGTYKDFLIKCGYYDMAGSIKEAENKIDFNTKNEELPECPF